MTRINAGIAPNELHRRHLIAEYRELPMVPAALRRSLRSAEPATILARIPPAFTLNKGHVTFFYNKLAYLQARYDDLVHEMRERGYSPDNFRPTGFDDLPRDFFGLWQETPEARRLVQERIALRQAEKPHLYEEREHAQRQP